MAADVLIRNGRIIDPAQGIDATGDVAIADGRVAQVGGDLSGYEAGRLLDATGCIVVPGLIDMHTHCSWGGTGLSIEADAYAWRVAATTTWVDAGSAGAANFDGFRRFLIEPIARAHRPLPQRLHARPGRGGRRARQRQAHRCRRRL